MGTSFVVVVNEIQHVLFSVKFNRAATSLLECTLSGKRPTRRVRSFLSRRKLIVCSHYGVILVIEIVGLVVSL
jgi:hypothetical protein